MAQKLWDFRRRNYGTARRNCGILERVHKPPSSQVSFSTQRGPHRWLRGSPEDAPATLVRLLTLRNGAGAGAERRVTAGGRRIVCGWHQRILGSIKT